MVVDAPTNDMVVDGPPMVPRGDPQAPMAAPPTISDAPTPPSETEPVFQEPTNTDETEQEAFKRRPEEARIGMLLFGYILYMIYQQQK